MLIIFRCHRQRSNQRQNVINTSYPSSHSPNHFSKMRKVFNLDSALQSSCCSAQKHLKISSETFSFSPPCILHIQFKAKDRSHTSSVPVKHLYTIFELWASLTMVLPCRFLIWLTTRTHDAFTSCSMFQRFRSVPAKPVLHGDTFNLEYSSNARTIYFSK